MTLIKSDNMTVNEIKELFLSTNGKIFSVVFKKSNGEITNMNCTTNIASHLAGGNSTLTDYPHLFVCWSLDRKGVRSVNLHNVVSAKLGGKHYVFNSELLEK